MSSNTALFRKEMYVVRSLGQGATAVSHDVAKQPGGKAADPHTQLRSSLAEIHGMSMAGKQALQVLLDLNQFDLRLSSRMRDFNLIERWRVTHKGYS